MLQKISAHNIIIALLAVLVGLSVMTGKTDNLVLCVGSHGQLHVELPGHDCHCSQHEHHSPCCETCHQQQAQAVKNQHQVHCCIDIPLSAGGMTLFQTASENASCKTPHYPMLHHGGFSIPPWDAPSSTNRFEHPPPAVDPAWAHLRSVILLI